MNENAVMTDDFRLYLALLLYGCGSVVMYTTWQAGFETFVPFAALSILSAILLPPRYAFSPLTVLYGYYAAWFVVAPLFAGKYVGVMDLPEYRASFPLLYSVFGAGVFSLLLGECLASKTSIEPRPDNPPSKGFLTLVILLLYILSTVFVALIVQFSGGLDFWINNPGQAFLNRAGTGVFVIGSHFSSLVLALATGYTTKQHRRLWPLLLFVAWLLFTSPVHGSKLQIGTLFILAFAPWIVQVRFYSVSTVALGAVAVAIFIAGMAFRERSILSSWGMLLSTLNYFTALENLAIALRDYPPSWMTTWFLPFNKIGMSLGFVEPTAYFDMNHMLTDRYRPDAWKIRATEQWPAETDLYLNFSFFFGLPILIPFFALHGWLYGYARRVNTAGAWFAAILLALSLISHLRGSLYNHIDFYMLPYILLIFLMFSGWRWDVARPTH